MSITTISKMVHQIRLEAQLPPEEALKQSLIANYDQLRNGSSTAHNQSSYHADLLSKNAYSPDELEKAKNAHNEAANHHDRLAGNYNRLRNSIEHHYGRNPSDSEIASIYREAQWKENEHVSERTRHEYQDRQLGARLNKLKRK